MQYYFSYEAFSKHSRSIFFHMVKLNLLSVLAVHGYMVEGATPLTAVHFLIERPDLTEHRTCLTNNLHPVTSFYIS